MELKFYYCKYCGKIIALTKDENTPTVCCDEVMTELKPCTTDGAFEKHVPVINKDGVFITVTVGLQFHPMTKEHYIMWVLLQTTQGFQHKFLKPGDLPIVDFVVNSGEQIVTVYAYCNIHKLWKTENVVIM